ncbi:MAG TPA: hypothetical protein DCS42_09630 [Nitrospiraceae bacterium]|jgi:hypothetical protein|nr:MAG: hypothetical protein A2X57_00355 [Nitrospirae bacterium GWD2_57_8]HAS54356.1 hypothetical protein [Nitrospiraceae bacterium]
MKKTIIFIAVIMLPGCVTPPQTSQELREGVMAGKMMTKMDHKDVNRPVNAVFNDVKKNADKCFNVRVTGLTPGTYGSQTQSSTYRSRSRMTGKTKGEMVMQMQARASGKMPEGGYFVLLADIEGTAANTTRVTVYGSSVGYGDVFEAIFEWAQGKDRSCPAWMR